MEYRLGASRSERGVKLQFCKNSNGLTEKKWEGKTLFTITLKSKHT